MPGPLIEVRLDPRLGQIGDILREVGSEVLPNTRGAVERAGRDIREAWIKTANTSFIKGYSTGAYNNAIFTVSPAEFGGLKVSVINSAAYAEALENGTAERDMKPDLLRSAKARIGAHGQVYIIIPFRHGTPRSGAGEAGAGDQRATMRSMSETLYKYVRRFKQSEATGFHNETNRYGQQVARRTYNWGDRLGVRGGQLHGRQATGGLDKFGRRRYGWMPKTSGVPESIGASPVTGYKHKANIHAGMVRMAAQAGSQMPRSEYMTFRVVSERWTDKKGRIHGSDPQSWFRPAQPALRIAQRTEAAVHSQVTDMVREAFEVDLKTIFESL